MLCYAMLQVFKQLDPIMERLAEAWATAFVGVSSVGLGHHAGQPSNGGGLKSGRLLNATQTIINYIIRSILIY